MDDEVRREIQDLKDGRIAVVGSVALNSNVASTAVTRLVTSSRSCVLLSPYDTGAKNEGIPRVVPYKGGFTIHHTNTTATRTYYYTIFTGNT